MEKVPGVVGGRSKDDYDQEAFYICMVFKKIRKKKIRRTQMVLLAYDVVSKQKI